MGQSQFFCLPQNVSLTQAKTYVQKILKNEDKVTINSSLHCLEIGIEQARSELVGKFLENRFGPVHQLTSAAPSSQCHIEIIASTDANIKNNTLVIGRKNKLSQSNSKAQNQVVSTLNILENHWATIEMDQVHTDVKCLKRGAHWQLEVRTGSEGAFLSTTINVETNQKVDLGNIVKDINQRRKNLSTDKGIEIKSEESNSTTSYILVIR